VSKRGRTVWYAGGGTIGSFKRGTGLCSSTLLMKDIWCVRGLFSLPLIPNADDVYMHIGFAKWVILLPLVHKEGG